MAADRKEYELLMKLTAALGSNFNSTFKTAMDTTKKLQDSLQNIKKVQGDVSAYKKTQESVRRLKEEKERLINSENANEAAIAKLNKQIEQEDSKLADLTKKLQAAGINTEKLTQENAKLEKAYERVKKSQEDLARINSKISENKAAISATRGEITKTVAIIAGAGAVFYKGFIEPAANLQSQMSTVKAISGATAEEMLQLTASAKQMGATTKFTAIESGKALEYMAMAGWKANEMTAGLPGIINLAAASGEDLATVSDIVTDALTAFGLKAGDAGHFADVLAATSASSNTNVAMLGESFKYAAPLAGAFKFSVEDTALALGLMANAGIKESQSGTSLRKIFTALSSDLQILQKDGTKFNVTTQNADGSMRELKSIIDDVRTAFNGMPLSEVESLQNELANTAKNLNIELKNENGKLKTQAELYADVQDAIQGLTEAGKVQEAESIAGKTAMAGLLSIVNAGEEDYNRLANAIYNANGAAEKMANTRMDNLQGDLTLAKSAWDGLATTIGELFLPNMRSAVQSVTSIIGKIDEFVKANPELIKTLAKVAGGLAGLKIAGLGAKLGFQEVELGTNLAKKALALFKGNMAESAAAAATGGGKIASLGKSLTGYFSNVKSSLGGVGDSIDKLAGGKLSGVFSKIGGGLQDGILKPLGGIGNKVTGALGGVGGKITGAFGGMGQQIAAGPLGKLGGVFKSIGGAGSALIKPLGGLSGIFGGLFGKIMPIIAIVSLLATLFVKLNGGDISAFLEPLQTAFEAIKPTLEAVMQQFMALGQELMPLLMSAAEKLAPLFFEIAAAILPVLASILQAIMPIITVIAQEILPVLLNALTTLMPPLTSIITSILPVIKMLIDALIPVITVLANVLGSVLSGAINAVMPIVQNLITVFQGVIDFITGVFTGNWQQAWEGIKNIFGGAFGALTELAKAPIRAVVSVINGVIGGLNKLKVPDWVPGIGGNGINIPLIPTFSKGTNFTPDTFVAGDINGKGGELVTGARGRKVFTAAETDAIFDNINRAKAINNAIPPAVSNSDTSKMPTIAQRVGGFISALKDFAINRTNEFTQQQLPEIPNTRNGGEPTFVYSPTINTGGKEPQNIEEIKQLLKEHGEEMLLKFKEFLRQQRENERRTNYA